MLAGHCDSVHPDEPDRIRIEFHGRLDQRELGCTCVSISGVASTTYTSRHQEIGALLEHGPRSFPLSLRAVGPVTSSMSWLAVPPTPRAQNNPSTYTRDGLTCYCALPKVLICFLSPPLRLFSPPSACKTLLLAPHPPRSSANVLNSSPKQTFFVPPTGPDAHEVTIVVPEATDTQRVVECLVAPTRSRATLGRHCPPSSHPNVPLHLSYRPLIHCTRARRPHAQARACIVTANRTTDLLHPIELVFPTIRNHHRRAASNSM